MVENKTGKDNGKDQGKMRPEKRGNLKEEDWRREKEEIKRMIWELKGKREKTRSWLSEEKQTRGEKKSRRPSYHHLIRQSKKQLTDLSRQEKEELQKTQAQKVFLEKKISDFQKEERKFNIIRLGSVFTLSLLMILFAVSLTLSFKEDLNFEKNPEPGFLKEIFSLKLPLITGASISEESGPLTEPLIVYTGELRTLAAPTHTTPLLSASDNPLNTTNANLTVYNQSTADADGNIVKNIINWYRDSKSLIICNVPMEGVNLTNTNNIYDYGATSSTIHLYNGSVVWNESAGHDGRGAYIFDGIDDYIVINTTYDTALHSKISVELWIKPARNYTEETTPAYLSHKNYGKPYEFYFDNSADALYFKAVNDSATSFSVKEVDNSYLDANSWYHLVGTANSTDVKLYRNGVATANGSFKGPLEGGSGNVFIGARTGATSGQFNGTIDDFKIWNISLTAEQVQALYLNRTDLIVAQETEPAQVWQARITPNDGSSDGAALFSNTVTILAVDTTPPAWVTNLNNQSAGSTWIYWNWTNPTNSDFNQNIIFINSANLANTSNNFHNATGLSSSTSYTITVHTKDTTGNINNTDVNSTASTLTLGLFNPNTVLVRLNATDFPNNRTTANLTCYANITDADSATVYGNYTWYNNSVEIEHLRGQGAGFNASTLSLLSTLGYRNTSKNQNWTCSVQGFDGSNYEGDWNNATITIKNSPPTHNFPILNSTNVNNNTNQNLTLYPQGVSDADNDPVKNITNWRVNSTSLMVLNMPFEGVNGTSSNNAWDYSGYGNNLSEFFDGGAAWNATGGLGRTGAYRLNGGDYLAVNNTQGLNLTTNFTITLWVYRMTDTGLAEPLLSASNDSDRNIDLSIAADDTVAYTLTNNSGLTFTDNQSGVSLGAWTFFAVNFNGSYMGFYVNGSIKGAKYAEADGFAVRGSALPWRLGRERTTNNFDGLIDQVQVYNRSLSSEQISALFSNRTDLIVSQETTAGQNWTTDITPNDGENDGASIRSNQVVILGNTLPTAPLTITPANGSSTTERSPSFIWMNSTDADGDAISYNLQVDNDPLFGNPEISVSAIAPDTGKLNTTYSTVTTLNVDTRYFWRVRANDSTGYGGWSNSNALNTSNFTVDSYLAVSFTVSLADFGSLTPGQVENTTDGTPAPFQAENAGNIFFNVSINGSAIFENIGLNRSNYQFKMRESEAGSFDTSLSSTAWKNVSKNLYGVFHLAELNWRNANDNFLTDLNITVPDDEPPGAKASNLTFTITGSGVS